MKGFLCHLNVYLSFLCRQVFNSANLHFKIPFSEYVCIAGVDVILGKGNSQRLINSPIYYYLDIVACVPLLTRPPAIAGKIEFLCCPKSNSVHDNLPWSSCWVKQLFIEGAGVLVIRIFPEVTGSTLSPSLFRHGEIPSLKIKKQFTRKLCF